MKKYFFLPVILTVFLNFPVTGAERTETIKALPDTDSILKTSSQARVSLITIEPGRELYRMFGHTAIRIYDNKNNIDTIFSFGIVPAADNPLFLIQFLRGSLPYRVAAGQFVQTILSDEQEQHRIWHEQELALSSDQISNLYSSLMQLAQPADSLFLYDFVLKNCAEEAFAAIDAATDNTITFHPDTNTSVTCRSIILSQIADKPFISFAASLLLGINADKPLAPKETLFMPEELFTELENATFTADHKTTDLVISTRDIMDQPDKKGTEFQKQPFNLLLLLWICAFLSMSLTIYQIFCRRTYRYQKTLEQTVAPFDLILFVFTGIAGLLILYESFFSSYYATRFNLNFLWLFPLHLFFSFTVFSRSQNKILSIYWILSLFFCTIPFLAGPFWPQRLAPEMQPCMFVLFCRELYQLVCRMPATWQRIKR